MCTGISLTLGKLKISYFMFVVDKILFSMPLMVMLLFISRRVHNNTNYLLFYSNSIIADLLTFFVSIIVFRWLIKEVKKLERRNRKSVAHSLKKNTSVRKKTKLIKRFSSSSNLQTLT